MRGPEAAAPGRFSLGSFPGALVLFCFLAGAPNALSALDFSWGGEARTEYGAYVDSSWTTLAQSWTGGLALSLSASQGPAEFSLRGGALFPRGGETALPLIDEARLRLALGDRAVIEAGRWLLKRSPALAFPSSDFFVRRAIDMFPLSPSILEPENQAKLSLVFGDFSLVAVYSPFLEAAPIPDYASPWFPRSSIPATVSIPYPQPNGTDLVLSTVSFAPDSGPPSFAEGAGEVAAGVLFGAYSLEVFGAYAWDPLASFLASPGVDLAARTYSLEFRSYDRRAFFVGLRSEYSGEAVSAWLDTAWSPRRSVAGTSAAALFQAWQTGIVPTCDFSSLDATTGILWRPGWGLTLSAELHRGFVWTAEPALLPLDPLASAGFIMGSWAIPGGSAELASFFSALGAVGGADASYAAGITLSLHPFQNWDLAVTLPYCWGSATGLFGQYGKRFPLMVSSTLRTQ